MHCDDGDELLETMADCFGEQGGRWTTVGEAASAVLALVAARVGKGRPAGTAGAVSSPAGRCGAAGAGGTEEKGPPVRGDAQHGGQVATAGETDSGRWGDHHDTTRLAPTSASANAHEPSTMRRPPSSDVPV